jgi:hypothetical protein
MKLNGIIEGTKTAVMKAVGKPGLVVKAHAPEILIGVGVVAVVAGTVYACKATLGVGDILDEAKDELDEIKEGEVRQDIAYADLDGDFEPEKVVDKKKMALCYAKTGLNIFKQYAPAATLMTIGVGCILGAHNIMYRRQLALIAAYEAIDKSYRKYRERVIAELGDDKDAYFKYGIKKSKVNITEEDPETGEKKKSKQEVFTIADERMVYGKDVSQYARFFDEASIEWKKSPEYNLHFLKLQEKHANDLLNARGYIFLNEVYKMLGLPYSQAGQIVGWVKDGNGDNYVDFGIYDYLDEQKRDFVNGYNPSILLDFNVDGVVYNQI